MVNDVSHRTRILRSLAPLDLDLLAKSSGWTLRKGGKIQPAQFCATLLAAAGLGNASLRIVAFLTGAFSGESVSKQALHKRVNGKACEFLESVLANALTRKAGVAKAAGALGFSRIILQDSTSIALPQHLLAAFKGAKNAFAERAGVKIQTTFELLSGRFVGFEVQEQRSPDQAFSQEGVQKLGQGDLLLRDLGYFCIRAFRELHKRNAHLLTRLQPKVKVLDPDTEQALPLLELLRRIGKLDREVLVGARERFPMRLVASPVSEQVAQERRRKLKANMKRRGCAASREQLDLLGWQIYLTTCSSERLAAEDIFELYRQRWAIEILFRGFKSHMSMDRIPAFCSENMLRCLLLAGLIRIVLSTVVASSILESESEGCHVSTLKLYSLVEALGEQPDFEDQANLENFRRHCCYEKRKRKNLPQRLEALG